MSTTITPAAIPTIYRGHRFRSRLEARWAAFFDAVGWPWTYEPVDLCGYIPDFILDFRKPLLVEVKPAIEIEATEDARRKIDRSGWNHEALVVGSMIPLPWKFAHASPFANCPTLGALREYEGDVSEWRWGAGELFQCIACERWSVLHAELSWKCRACGFYDGHEHVAGVEPDAVRETWARAGNAVQWMPNGRTS